MDEAYWNDVEALACGLRFVAQATECADCAARLIDALRQVQEGRRLTLDEHAAISCSACDARLEADNQRITASLTDTISQAMTKPKPRLLAYGAHASKS